MNIRTLSPLDVSASDGRPEEADHPMRVVTEAVVADRSSWDGRRRDGVRAIFDVLAATWTAERRHNTARLLPVADALDRGHPGSGRCLELGSGTGLASSMLLDHFDLVIASDLSAEMLKRSIVDTERLQADGVALPFADRCFDCVAMINMLLFPEEIDRVLAPGGSVVWVSSRGEGTPIYLPGDVVANALPGDWCGVSAAAGSGTWCVLRRHGISR